MATPDQPRLTVALPPSRGVVDSARRAEELGYERIWLFDSPALYGDVWIALARIAEATPHIGLGTAVAVPSLRNVMVTASAIATIEELAPGRLIAAFGTGFTARMAMGRRPMSWSRVGDYVTTLRRLLAGEVVEVEGARGQMLHSPGYGPPRPINVPLWLAPVGPKGFAVSRQVADGVVLVGQPPERSEIVWPQCALLVPGTVLQPGEDHTTGRVRAAAGPWFTTGYHAMWEWGPAALDHLEGGPEWRKGIEAERPDGERHLAVHEGHVVTVTERDQPLLESGGAALLATGWTGDPTSIQKRVQSAVAAGVTEIMYSPAGPDIGRELEAFAGAARGSR